MEESSADQYRCKIYMFFALISTEIVIFSKIELLIASLGIITSSGNREGKLYFVPSIRKVLVARVGFVHLILHSEL